jgi:hypothetical protein
MIAAPANTAPTYTITLANLLLPSVKPVFPAVMKVGAGRNSEVDMGADKTLPTPLESKSSPNRVVARTGSSSVNPLARYKMGCGRLVLATGRIS